MHANHISFYILILKMFIHKLLNNHIEVKNIFPILNNSTSQIFQVTLLTVSHTILVMRVCRICIGPTTKPLVHICLHPHYLSAWYCIDIVRRNSILVTHGGKKAKPPLRSTWPLMMTSTRVQTILLLSSCSRSWKTEKYTLEQHTFVDNKDYRHYFPQPGCSSDKNHHL